MNAAGRVLSRQEQDLFLPWVLSGESQSSGVALAQRRPKHFKSAECRIQSLEALVHSVGGGAHASLFWKVFLYACSFKTFRELGKYQL